MSTSILRLLFFFFITGAHRLAAQELVINGSLEDVNLCTEFNAKCSPAAWFFVNQVGPRGFVRQRPKPATSGKEYFDLMVANDEDNHRTYWQTMLSCPLVKGARYEIGLNVAADNTGPNLNDVGFYFTDQLLFSKWDTVLQPREYVAFTDARVKKLAKYWFAIKKTFVATSDNQFVLIGNFSNLDNSEIIRKRKFKGSYLNIMLDDVSIKRVDGAGCSDAGKLRDSLYAIHDRHHSSTHSTLPDSIIVPAILPATDSISKPDTIRLSNLLFGYNSHILTDTASLLPYSKSLSDSKIASIRIAGFADDRGSDTYNKSLSLRRAEEVKRLLSRMFGIPPSIIKVSGEGRSNTFSDRELNRRVEIYIYYLFHDFAICCFAVASWVG
ncbi:MAG: OmpA family protein [Pedobacter sp.]|nr:MAG: OmpA family protein [Pedobacter sp.]